MRLIANRQLRGAYGTVVPGQVFDVDDEVAASLLLRGVARKPEMPRVLYETKVVEPEAPEVQADAMPFRNLPVPDSEPAQVDSASDPVVPAADLLKSGVADNSRRRRYTRPGSER